MSVLGVAARNEASAALTLTGPRGETIDIDHSQDLVAFGDVTPQVALKWNAGVHNFMVHGMGDAPAGNDDSNRLANLGIGRGAIDFGGGYAFFDPAAGNEFPAVAGMRYSFETFPPDIRTGWIFTSIGAPPTLSPNRC